MQTPFVRQCPGVHGVIWGSNLERRSGRICDWTEDLQEVAEDGSYQGLLGVPNGIVRRCYSVGEKTTLPASGGGASEDFLSCAGDEGSGATVTRRIIEKFGLKNGDRWPGTG